MFDRYVAQTRPSWKRRALIIASLSAHVIAGVVLGIWSILHVEEIAPPTLSLTFFSAPPPPPPPPKKKKATPTEKKPETQPKVMTQPDPAKLQQPKIEEKKEEPKQDDEGEDDGEEGGEKGGQKGGKLGGLPTGQQGGTGTQPAAKPAAPPPAPKTVAGFTLIAQQLAHPNPHLPEAVMASRPHQDIKGMYKVCIKNDGHISDVFTMTGIPGADDQIAAQIKSSWVYKPQPVPICFVAALTFKVP